MLCKAIFLLQGKKREKRKKRKLTLGHVRTDPHGGKGTAVQKRGGRQACGAGTVVVISLHTVSCYLVVRLLKNTRSISMYTCTHACKQCTHRHTQTTHITTNTQPHTQPHTRNHIHMYIQLLSCFPFTITFYQCSQPFCFK